MDIRNGDENGVTFVNCTEYSFLTIQSAGCILAFRLLNYIDSSLLINPILRCLIQWDSEIGI